eukprot:scaffold443_cov177-Amphora_coffeaeformis.AAC.4
MLEATQPSSVALDLVKPQLMLLSRESTTLTTKHSPKDVGASRTNAWWPLVRQSRRSSVLSVKTQWNNCSPSFLWWKLLLAHHTIRSTSDRIICIDIAGASDSSLVEYLRNKVPVSNVYLNPLGAVLLREKGIRSIAVLYRQITHHPRLPLSILYSISPTVIVVVHYQCHRHIDLMELWWAESSIEDTIGGVTSMVVCAIAGDIRNAWFLWFRCSEDRTAMKILIHRVFLSFLLVPLASCWGWLPDDKEGGAVVVSNHEEDHHDHHHDPHCGVAHVSNMQAELDQARMRRLFESHAGRHLQKLSCDELCDGCIEIETVFHYTTFNFRGTPVLPHPTSAMRRLDSGDNTLRVSDFTTRATFLQVLRDQIAFVNNVLRGTPFRFRLRENDITATTNDLWMRYPLDFIEDIARSLGSGDPRVLDVYLHYTILFQSEASNPPLRVGQAYFPSQQFSGGNPDGMFIRYDVLTGGGFFGLDQGITFLHEWGHWMGLCTFRARMPHSIHLPWEMLSHKLLCSLIPCFTDHTFRTSDGSEFGCENFPNDYVTDTPAHQGDSMRFDCRDYIFPNNQPFPDTCPNLPGRDPVLNYMNFV